MLTQRPFRNVDDVFASAERIWWDLGREEWLEAFAAHPRIGETEAQTHGHTDAQAQARQEQAGAAAASESVKAQLAEANRAYEARFGYIYIVCATGKSAEEMLDLCRARLANDGEAELRVAAGEQARITQLRLTTLLELGT
jgi:2-oxo-4-hydroxy-4-carboxy-5-ureidoimidazoline decarboxylase